MNTGDIPAPSALKFRTEHMLGEEAAELLSAYVEFCREHRSPPFPEPIFVSVPTAGCDNAVRTHRLDECFELLKVWNSISYPKVGFLLTQMQFGDSEGFVFMVSPMRKRETPKQLQRRIARDPARVFGPRCRVLPANPDGLDNPIPSEILRDMELRVGLANVFDDPKDREVVRRFLTSYKITGEPPEPKQFLAIWLPKNPGLAEVVSETLRVIFLAADLPAEYAKRLALAGICNPNDPNNALLALIDKRYGETAQELVKSGTPVFVSISPAKYDWLIEGYENAQALERYEEKHAADNPNRLGRSPAQSDRPGSR